MLSELEFGSYLVFSPHGESEESRKSRDIRTWVKEDRIPPGRESPISQLVAAAIARRRAELPFGVFFGGRTVLVPVPRSGLMKPGSLWPALNIAAAMMQHGLGWKVVPLLRRRKAVPKSAFAGPGERPKPEEHYRSMDVERSFGEVEDILLVDDIVTKGSTFLGAGSRLAECFAGASVRGFAVLRTMGLQPEIEHVFAPWRGRIILSGDRADRDP